MTTKTKRSKNSYIIWTQILKEFPFHSLVVIASVVLTTVLILLNLFLFKYNSESEKLKSQVIQLQKEAVHFKDLTQILDDQIYLGIITRDFHYKASFINYQDQLEGLIQFEKDPGYEVLSKWQARIFTLISLDDFRAAEQTYFSPKFAKIRSDFEKHFLGKIAEREKALLKSKKRFGYLYVLNLVLIGVLIISYFFSWISFAFLIRKYSSKIIANLDKSLAVLAHDFRSPIAAILGYSACLKDGLDGPVTESQVASLKKMEKIGHNLLELMNDLLDIAKIQSGQVQLVVEPLDIGDIMRYCIEAIAPLIASKNLEFKTILPKDPLIARIDGVKTTEIISNLLHNAYKFTEKGTIELGHFLKPGVIEIYVKDTGEGLAKESMEKIFEPFVQADLSVKSRVGGVGLGLSIAQHFAQIQGGDLTVTSTLGSGSQFTLTLPYREGE